MRLILAVIFILGGWSSAFACLSVLDPGCKEKKVVVVPPSGGAKVGKSPAGGGYGGSWDDAQPSKQSGGPKPAGSTTTSEMVHPVRQYLAEKDIPPQGVAAYGIVALKTKPTRANAKKLKMVCESFLAHFDRSESSPYPVKDQMVTVWPLDDPEAEREHPDDCDWILKHYVLGAASTAMAYAIKQHMKFDGEGPFLIGWSPAESRGQPDKLVLVVDMSKSNDQAAIDHDFDFWKDKIVNDPESWRGGFSIEGVRQSLKDFVDHYGDDIVKSIKMVGL